jgi:hypothetical protein
MHHDAANKHIRRSRQKARRVGRKVDGLASAYERLFTAESGFNLAFQKREGFLEIVPVGRRSTAERDVHVDQAVTPACIAARSRIV